MARAYQASKLAFRSHLALRAPYGTLRERGSPNQVLTHAARAAAKQLNKLFSHSVAARAKGPGQGKERGVLSEFRAEPPLL